VCKKTGIKGKKESEIGNEGATSPGLEKMGESDSIVGGRKVWKDTHVARQSVPIKEEGILPSRWGDKVKKKVKWWV